MRKMTSQASILLVCFFVYILAHGSSAAFPKNRKRNCAVSVWSSWGSANPAGTRTRTRVILRNPRNGGLPCPALTQRGKKTDPWDRKQVIIKVKNAIVTGRRVFFKKVGSDAATQLPRDLLFIIDMSGSISRQEWDIMKEKLADLIGKLCGTIGPEFYNNRIAIVTFSSRVVLNFDFQTHWTLASVRQAILGMPRDAQWTCTGDAFVYANRYMFEPSSGVRSATESAKEILVLTDGRSNCGANLTIAVRKLRVKGLVSALAIGEYSDAGKREIESMVSNPKIDHIFSLQYFFKFGEMVDAIVSDEDCSLFTFR